MPTNIEVHGSGVAGCCCTHLLRSGGLEVLAESSTRTDGPVLMLSDQTQTLLTDVFGHGGLFGDAIQIKKRIVLWGRNSEAAVLPHSGIVVSEAVLLDRLWRMVAANLSVASDSRAIGEGKVDWQIFSSQSQITAEAHHFGSRMATTTSVTFKSEVMEDACWVEALENGWLFLLPCGEGRGSLISVGGVPEALVAESRLIARQIDKIDQTKSRFPAYPRIVTPLCAANWLACGGAALGFDPICGEGAGNAVREAILASAVIRAAEKDLDVDELMALYTSRLMSGFARHLKLCQDFYEAAGGGAWWQSELQLLRTGMEWTQQRMNGNEGQRYRLAGFELQQVG